MCTCASVFAFSSSWFAVSNVVNAQAACHLCYSHIYDGESVSSSAGPRGEGANGGG